MSNPVIATTTQRRAIVGTLDEALALASEQVREVDAWTGASIAINPVMRDHQTGTFQWEVMVSGNPTALGKARSGPGLSSPYPPAIPG